MAYSIVGIIAILVHLIVNIDVFTNIRGKKKFPGEKYYLFFLLSVIVYHITDGFWGFLYDAKLVTAVFADTTVYFISMAASILLWGIFVYYYLGAKNKVITYSGMAVFTFQIVVIIINFFYPVLFEISEDCVYKALPVRYVMLTVQILIFLLLSVYTLISSIKNKGSLRRRHITISVFGLFMAVAIALQVAFPLMPFYSMGYLLGICILRSFVIADEKENQNVALREAKYRVSFDQLTGALSKYAYVDMEKAVDGRIGNGDMMPFAIIVFDLNDLKQVNDNQGHEAGDKYILEAVQLIKEYFPKNPIYRIGGDEFVLFLLGESFNNRTALLENFNNIIDENVKKKETIVVSAGLAVYIPNEDNTFLQVFNRADAEMYKRKRELKANK